MLESKQAGARGLRVFTGLATLFCAAALAGAAIAAPAPVSRTGATGAAPSTPVANTPPPVGTIIYDNITDPVGPGLVGQSGGPLDYYAGQGGNEAIDDLHLFRNGSADWLEFAYYNRAPASCSRPR